MPCCCGAGGPLLRPIDRRNLELRGAVLQPAGASARADPGEAVLASGFAIWCIPCAGPSGRASRAIMRLCLRAPPEFPLRRQTMSHAKSAAMARPAEGWPASDRPSAPSNARSATAAASRPASGRLRARSPGSELILLHRLRASQADAGSGTDHARRIIELTARDWLGQGAGQRSAPPTGKP